MKNVEWKMKNVVKATAVVVMVLLLAGPASAAVVYTDTYEAEDTTIYHADLGDDYTIDGDYIVANYFTVEGSFNGWEDLSGYTDVTASLTFTWHDDDNLNYYSMYGVLFTDTNNYDTVNDTTGTPAYPDLAAVTLDGTTAFESVEVGVTNTTNPSTYVYTLTDLSILDDGELTYLVEAMTYNSTRTDFVLDSVTLTIEGTPSAVPVPAAAWLLGSGLAGLIGIRRQRGHG